MLVKCIILHNCGNSLCYIRHMKRQVLVITEGMDALAEKLALHLCKTSGRKHSKAEAYRVALEQLAKREKVSA